MVGLSFQKQEPGTELKDDHLSPCEDWKECAQIPMFPAEEARAQLAGHGTVSNHHAHLSAGSRFVHEVRE